MLSKLTCVRCLHSFSKPFARPVWYNTLEFLKTFPIFFSLPSVYLPSSVIAMEVHWFDGGILQLLENCTTRKNICNCSKESTIVQQHQPPNRKSLTVTVTTLRKEKLSFLLNCHSFVKIQTQKTFKKFGFECTSHLSKIEFRIQNSKVV